MINSTSVSTWRVETLPEVPSEGASTKNEFLSGALEIASEAFSQGISAEKPSIPDTSISTQADSITFETKVLNIKDQIVEETIQKASNVMKKNLAEGQNPDKSRFLAHKAFVRFKETLTKEFPEASYKNEVYLAILSQQRFFCCKLREQLHELMAPKVEIPSQLTEQIIKMDAPKLDPEKRKRIKLELNDWMRNPEARGNTEEAARRILEAFDTNAEKLTLERLDLTLLPNKAIDSLSRVSSLDLSRNSLTSFSAKSGSFPNLKQLYLSRNSLTNFSAERGSFPNLEQLNLDNNSLTRFTSEKCSFPNLKTLYLSFNFFTTFSGESGFFPNLERLYLNNNSLTGFASEKGSFLNLDLLDLSFNSFTSFSSENNSFSSLRTLYLSFNSLTSVSNDGDSFSHLTKLDLGENFLTELPPSLAHLMKLCRLNTKNNPLSAQASTAFQNAIDKTRRENKRLGPEWSTTIVDQQKQIELLELIDLLKNWIQHPKAKGLTEEASKRILEAFDTNAEELTLKDLRITFLPSKALDLLPRLSRLNLSLNSLTDFSVKRGSLPNLKLLDLSDNQIAALSPELADLSNRCVVLTKNNPLSKQANILEEKRSTLCLHINKIILKVADAKSPLASSKILKKSSQEEALNQDQLFQYLEGTEAIKFDSEEKEPVVKGLEQSSIEGTRKPRFGAQIR